jgi:hypothetical protein
VIRVKFTPPNDTAWIDWRRRVWTARKEMYRRIRDEKVDKPADLISEKLYKDQRDRFLEAFHWKCAYCELKIVPGQRKGDVEHFRPKGRVMGGDGKQVFSAADKHPGYFWLAYHWQNLLPSCLACNRPGEDPQGFASGKWDRFPVENGYWAKTWRDIVREKPVLLNPWKDDPDEHLVFDDPTGVIGYKTDRGRISIDVLGLNRDGLPEARRKAYKTAVLAFRRLNEAYAREDDDEAVEIEKEFDAIWSGEAEFSAAASAALEAAKRRHDERRAKQKWGKAPGGNAGNG